MEIYLDNAATSHPKPACTLRAVQDAMTRFNANPGRAGHARSLAAGRLVLEARETLARAQRGIPFASYTRSTARTRSIWPSRDA